MTMHKRCPRCAESKPLEAFGGNRARRNGLTAYCRACKSDIAREYRKRNPEQLRAYQQAYRRRNPEQVRAYQQAYREQDPEKERARHRAYRQQKAREQEARRALPAHTEGTNP